jgi:hypothetical protein
MRHGIVFDKELAARCMVTEIGHREAAQLIRNHYLKKMPGVTVLCMGLWRDCFLVGTAVFALPPRETNVRYKATVWELARLWIDDAMPRNTETWFLSRAIRHVAKTGGAECLVSYADPSAGHSGVIYRASNWTADGMTETRKSPRCDYESNGKKYSRRSHIPEGAIVERVPRTSKHRFVYRIATAREAGTVTTETHGQAS